LALVTVDLSSPQAPANGTAVKVTETSNNISFG
jgi:hypothetical protein